MSFLTAWNKETLRITFIFLIIFPEYIFEESFPLVKYNVGQKELNKIVSHLFPPKSLNYSQSNWGSLDFEWAL